MWKLLWKTLILAFILVGCRRSLPDRAPSQYSENGRLWAYGVVALSEPIADVSVIVRRQTGAQSLDTFVLEGRQGSDAKNMAYVDFHPQREELLSLVYSVEFRVQDGQKGDIYAVLEKGGRSYYGRQKVHLGQALFKDQEDQAVVELDKELHLSGIADGPAAGEWALHLPDVQKIVLRPWQGMCPRYDSLSFGQGTEPSPFLLPQEADICRPIQPQDDLCQGDPTRSECRPQAPQLGALMSSQAARYTVENLEKIEATKAVFAMAKVSTDARLEFRSAAVRVSDASVNREWCAKKFSALGTTIGERRNEACTLVPTPAEPKDGYLTCAVMISFDRAQTFMEKVCNVTAVFLGSQDDVVRVQILKR